MGERLPNPSVRKDAVVTAMGRAMGRLRCARRPLADLIKGRTFRAWQFRREEEARFPGTERDIDDHVDAALDWILRAQLATNDGGVAQSYDLLNRVWRTSYPETTGYIVCTLIRAATAGYGRDGALVAASRRMGDWLISTQMENGAFYGGNVGWSDKKPAVFNTGQILKGLTDLVSSGLDENSLVRDSAKRAADWMVEIQDSDGAWRKGLSNLTSAPLHAYNIRAAWALARYGFKLNEERAVDAATRNARWLCAQQRNDGWFDHMAFNAGDAPLTHTIAYTIQGLMEIGALLGEEEFLVRSRAAARPVFATRNQETGSIPGQFGEGWRPVGEWTSNTGNAQMAIIGHRLDAVLGGSEFTAYANDATAFCKRLQEFDAKDPGRKGAVRGSFPGHLGYGRYWYMNWTQKFFLDALLCEKGIQPI